MSEERFPYLKNFLKPTREVGAKSDKTPSAELSALLTPGGLVRPENKISSGEGDTGGLLEEFHRGEVDLDATPNTAPQTPAPGERVLACADCPQFQANSGPNPSQGWGRCLKRNKGRYGCAMACEAALTDDIH